MYAWRWDGWEKTGCIIIFCVHVVESLVTLVNSLKKGLRWRIVRISIKFSLVRHWPRVTVKGRCTFILMPPAKNLTYSLSNSWFTCPPFNLPLSLYSHFLLSTISFTLSLILKTLLLKLTTTYNTTQYFYYIICLSVHFNFFYSNLYNLTCKHENNDV